MLLPGLNTCGGMHKQPLAVIAGSKLVASGPQKAPGHYTIVLMITSVITGKAIFMYVTTVKLYLETFTLQDFNQSVLSVFIYRVIQNDCWGFNNLSYTIHLR
jgi:hypothetical protein